MRFYRGITVLGQNAEGLIEKIRTGGIHTDAGWESVSWVDLKPKLDEIWGRTKITWEDTRPASPRFDWVYACGEEAGALYYACIHNRTKDKDTPLTVVFEADVCDVIVDGRDSLYKMFQLGDPSRSRPIAERIFGRAVLKYLDRAWSSEDDKERIALCDLAVQDDDVILSHFGNKTVIEATWGPRFRSAFLIRTPIPAERIIDVRLVGEDFTPPSAEVSVKDIR